MKDQMHYSVKIISPHTPDSILIKDWESVSVKFSDVYVMKNQLSVDFAEYIQETEFTFGYIQPGHGAKGKQKSLEERDDLTTMYELYSKRKQIVLWLKVAKTKRPLKVDDTSSKKQCRTTNHGSHLEKISEVQAIFEDLEKRHGNSKQYSPEQLRAWAHMIQLKKHESYEAPPDKPFLKLNKKVPTATQKSLSPGKRISYRTECIEQLGKWHELMEKGAISQSQFKDLQETILGDIKQL